MSSILPANAVIGSTITYHGKARITYHAWLIVSRESGHVLVCRNGEERMVPAVKRGIPQGAVVFDTVHDAEREASFMSRMGFLPLHGQLVPKQFSWN